MNDQHSLKKIRGFKGLKVGKRALKTDEKMDNSEESDSSNYPDFHEKLRSKAKDLKLSLKINLNPISDPSYQLSTKSEWTPPEETLEKNSDPCSNNPLNFRIIINIIIVIPQPTSLGLGSPDIKESKNSPFFPDYTPFDSSFFYSPLNLFGPDIHNTQEIDTKDNAYTNNSHLYRLLYKSL